MSKKKKRSIYREEVLAAQIAKHGDVLLVRPISFSLITLFIVLIFISIIVFCSVTEYRKSNKVKGVITTPNGETNVIAFKPGVVETLLVAEGETVKKGQVLYRINTSSQGLGGVNRHEMAESLSNTIALVKQRISFQQELNQLEMEEVNSKVIQLQDESAQVTEDIQLQTQYLDVLNKKLAKATSASVSSGSAENDYDSMHQQVLEKKISLHELSKKQLELQNLAESTAKKLRSVELKGKSMVVGYQQQVAELERNLLDTQSAQFYLLRAPQNGIVSGVHIKEGQFVENNNVLMTLMSAQQDLVAEIYIPTSQIGFIESNQSVSLRYYAFPYQKFGIYHGKIDTLSRSVIEPSQAKMGALIDSPAYRAVVTLDSQYVESHQKKIALLPGMQLDAEIAGDSKSILAWMFESIVSAKSEAKGEKL